MIIMATMRKREKIKSEVERRRNARSEGIILMTMIVEAMMTIVTVIATATTTERSVVNGKEKVDIGTRNENEANLRDDIAVVVITAMRRRRTRTIVAVIVIIAMQKEKVVVKNEERNDDLVEKNRHRLERGNQVGIATTATTRKAVDLFLQNDLQ